MLEAYPLITTIVTSVVFAFLLGFIANRLHFIFKIAKMSSRA
jgi:predicted Kef-type K+ transport protein